MPRLLAALYGSAALALAGAPVAFACATPSEQAMFDVAGLKSELMVTALSCDADSQYNAFVLRYQGMLRRTIPSSRPTSCTPTAAPARRCTTRTSPTSPTR